MAGKYRLLSYPLEEGMPFYGGAGLFEIKPDKQIKRNDSCNTFEVGLSNHAGTHIDAPRHFYDTGRPIAEFPITDFIFSRPHIIDRPKDKDELISEDDVRGIPDGCDLVLFRTGFYKYRKDEKYMKHNPGISAEAARLLRSEYPFLKAAGIDAISFSAFQNREAGRQAHGILLKEDGFPGGPLFLIEGLNLEGRFDDLRAVYAVPLFIKGVDSAPCTVFGEFYEKTN
ncbi:MAG: cyclase family protein [Candidatus Omnitrophica bacterium]|nr:cyclase family protein [Candidatus Omnitrophota bacterium]